jgi:hypothetical protein
MRRTGLLLLGIFALAIEAVGCGGGGSSDKSFDVDGIGITFKYPSDFKPIKNISFGQSAGADAAARAGISVDTVNAITVSRYDLKVPITKDNLAKFKAEVDSVISQLAGKRVNGREVEYGGLPGYEYTISLTRPVRGLSRLEVLFDRATEYLFNCQSAPAKRSKVEDACRKALDTLQPK